MDDVEDRHRGSRLARGALLLGAITWLVVVTATLLNQPAEGAPSREELASALERALNDHDAAELEPLVGPPVTGAAADVAAYLAEFAAGPHAGSWHVLATPDGDLLVADDTGTRRVFAAVHADGRWRFDPLGRG
ncbi:hypothetical protein [Actinosynnema sp. NPDC020468]|uniref:hypothetical protein n=1 Tax=Actinosynnema sp. NPDC020468 TaxID=3154488 RepID=UPI0033F390F5